MNDFIFLAVRVVILIAFFLVTKYLIPVLKNYAQIQMDQQLYDVIKSAVKAAEQTIKETGKGAVKKEQVINDVISWLNKRGLPIDEAQINRILEDCVYVLNNSKI